MTTETILAVLRIAPSRGEAAIRLGVDPSTLRMWLAKLRAMGHTIPRGKPGRKGPTLTPPPEVTP